MRCFFLLILSGFFVSSTALGESPPSKKHCELPEAQWVHHSSTDWATRESATPLSPARYKPLGFSDDESARAALDKASHKCRVPKKSITDAQRIEHCHRMLELSPTPKLYALMIRALRFRAPECALPYFEVAAAIEPSQAALWSAKRANYKAALGDHEGALADVQQAVESGFRAFSWLRDRRGMEKMYADPVWASRLDALVPEDARPKLEAPSAFEDYIDRTSDYLYFCANGRVYYNSGWRDDKLGRWHQSDDGAVSVHLTHRCESKGCEPLPAPIEKVIFEPGTLSEGLLAPKKENFIPHRSTTPFLLNKPDQPFPFCAQSSEALLSEPKIPSSD